MNAINFFEKNFIYLFSLTYILVAIFPSFKFFDSYNYLLIFLIFFFLFFYFFIDNYFFKKIRIYTLISLLLLFFLFSLAIGSRNISTGFNYLIYVHVIFCSSLLSLISNKKYSEVNLKRIVRFSLILFLLVSLITLANLFYDPLSSRNAKVDEYSGRLLALQGIGGYNFIYANCLMLIAILPALHYWKYFDLRTKLFLALFFFISLLTIVQSNFFTAIIVTLSGIWFFYFQLRSFLVLFFTFILVIFLLIFLQNLSSPLDGESMNLTKLFEIATFLFQGELGDYGFGRVDRYVEGLAGIEAYPFFGMMNQGVDVISTYGYSQHSAILDVLSLYGVILGSLSILVFLYPLFMIKLKNELLKKSFNSIFLSYILVLILNINTIDTMVVMYLVIPLIFIFLDKTLTKIEITSK